MDEVCVGNQRMRIGEDCQILLPRRKRRHIVVGLKTSQAVECFNRALQVHANVAQW